MPNQTRPSNPFTVQTPEGISAGDAHSLFVNVFTDFHRIPYPGHSFLHGPRGSGKSMMFRYLQPDCQCLEHACTISDLPFFAVYVPIKTGALDISEFARLENQHASTLVNEHYFVLYVAVRVFTTLAKLDVGLLDHVAVDECRELVRGDLCRLLTEAGWTGTPPSGDSLATPSACFAAGEHICGEAFRAVTQYLKRSAFSTGPVPYTGALCGYQDFLLPLFRLMRTRLSFMPKKPLFLLIDDADNLNETQTRILNTWVSYRTSEDVSIKISTQLTYKTYLTVSGITIDSPHDYSEVNIAELYTSARSMYRKRILQIVEKRFALYGIGATPDSFFPPDESQEAAIAKIAEQIRKAWEEGKGRGYRADDDATRYARPQYIQSLKGQRKSGHRYSYAGFAQLVDISSGVIRYFLEPAALMFSKEESQSAGRPITHIRPAIQNEVVRDEADKFMVAEFEKMSKSEVKKAGGHAEVLERATRLRNLLMSMGKTFHEILISDRSERRVISVALYDTPDADTMEVLNLGVQYGYLQESTIGNKEGTGRTRLYVLSRRLAPFFLLDPTGFAGYLFVKSSDLVNAMLNPTAQLRNLRRDSEQEQAEPYFMPLFDQGAERAG